MKQLKLLLVAIVGMFAICANAQELKKTVLTIQKFTYTNDFSEADVEMLRNRLIEAIRKTGRVIVVDASDKTESLINAEAERRKKESAMDANQVGDMVSLNANSILSANLEKLTASREIYEDYAYEKVGDKTKKVLKAKIPYYSAVLSYTIKIINPENGTIENQETFNYKVGSINLYDKTAQYDNEKDAMDAMMRSCVNADQIAVFIMNTFKAQGKILQVKDGDEKKAKTVYINLGSEDGISAKQKLEVFKEIDIAGEKSNELIGEIEVAEIMGRSRCLGKIKKGGKEIRQALDAGFELPVKTRNVKIGFWGGVK